jgi:protein tyrosine/serine phosphatase
LAEYIENNIIKWYNKNMVLKSSNFREINIGKISSKILFRSNHPICNNNQVKDIVLAANKEKINTIINLSDDMDSLRSKAICCPWYKKIIDNNNVLALNIPMNFDIFDSEFCKKIKDGVIFLLGHNPPYLIHCEAGIDRTGFLSIIFESLMDAQFNEIVKDYMLSFVDENEYTLNDSKDGILFLRNLFTKISGEIFTTNKNLRDLIIDYLKEKIKLNDNEILLLDNKLKNNTKSSRNIVNSRNVRRNYS